MTPTEGQTTTKYRLASAFTPDDHMRASACRWRYNPKISILCCCPTCSTVYREARQENEERNSTTGAKTP